MRLNHLVCGILLFQNSLFVKTAYKGQCILILFLQCKRIIAELYRICTVYAEFHKIIVQFTYLPAGMVFIIHPQPMHRIEVL